MNEDYAAKEAMMKAEVARSVGDSIKAVRILESHLIFEKSADTTNELSKLLFDL